MDFRRDSLVALSGQVRAGTLAAREVVAHALARIEEVNDAVNAFVVVDADAALGAAARIDELVAAGTDPGPLAGIPVGVKDLEDAAGLPTTYGCSALAGAPPAAHSSLLVDRLVRAGAVVVGKTNTPELGWTGDTFNRLFGPTFNPLAPAHSPGGSSGGSAAAIASGMVPLATGSDGGGSIRIPSALCGLPGFKASAGRVPDGDDAPPGWPGLSVKGPMAASTADIAVAFDAVMGPSPTALDSRPRPRSSWAQALGEGAMPAAVVWSPTLGYAPVDAEVLAVCEQAVATLSSHGCTCVTAEVVFDADPVTTWMTLVDAFVARTVMDLGGSAVLDQLDERLARMVQHGLTLSAVELVAAMDDCHRLNLRLAEVLRQAPVLLTPTTAAPAPLSGQPGVINGVPDVGWVRFTYPFNLTRSPAGTVYAGSTTAGLPVGLQIIGGPGADLEVLRTMHAFEQVLGMGPLPR